MSQRIFTGIGSRETCEKILLAMERVSTDLAADNFIGRSGKAVGPDQATQAGFEFCRSLGIDCIFEAYLPNLSFNKHFGSEDWNIVVTDTEIRSKAMAYAASVHPAYNKMIPDHRELHIRNVYQILGKDLQTRSKFVLFSAPETHGVVSGGTATAVHLARKFDIPTFNFLRNRASNLRKFLAIHT
jgi:hypothetical protein